MPVQQQPLLAGAGTPGDRLPRDRPPGDLNQRRAAAYTPSPRVAARSTVSMEPTFTTEQAESGTEMFLTSSATDSMSGKHTSNPHHNGISRVISDRLLVTGCMRKLIRLVDPDKWPRVASALTEGSAGLTKLDWITRLVLPVLFAIFYGWMYHGTTDTSSS